MWRAVLPTPQFTRPIGLLWNRLPRVKKLLSGWPKIGLLFICLPAAALFFFKCANFLSIQRVFEPYNIQEHSFHQFQGLRRPKEQSILIIHFMRKLTIYLLFRPIGWFWLFYDLKAPKYGKLGVWLLDKNWATFKLPAAGKKSQFTAVWCSEVLATLVKGGLSVVWNRFHGHIHY